MWAKVFEEKATKIQPFHVDTKAVVKTPLMYQKCKVLYSHDEKGKLALAALPYSLSAGSAQEKCEFVVILPDEVEGLPALEVLISRLKF